MGSTHEAHDRLVNHLFTSGLTLAAVLNLHRLDREVASRVHDVVEQLDAAIREIRHLALAEVASEYERSQLHVASTPGVETLLHLASPNGERRSLCRFAVDEVFAYSSHGHDFYRIIDDELWAHESDGFLLAPHSGTPFARRVGRVYYEVESEEPLYYERA